MRQILIVEDNLQIQTIAKSCLKDHRVFTVTHLSEAEKTLNSSVFDLIVLDIQLPDGDGLKFLAKLKTTSGKEIPPVIFLTQSKEISDIVMGFELGADDYISKPFNPFEFKARVESKLRKNLLKSESGSRIILDNLVLDLAKYRAEITDNVSNPQTLDLTPLEFKILAFFVKRKDNVVQRDQIINQIWGQDVVISDRVVDTHISNIRKKIKGATFSISSIYGEGYSLKKKEVRSA